MTMAETMNKRFLYHNIKKAFNTPHKQPRNLKTYNFVVDVVNIYLKILMALFECGNSNHNNNINKYRKITTTSKSHEYTQ